MATLLEVDTEGWLAQLPQMQASTYAEFGDKLPAELPTSSRRSSSASAPDAAASRRRATPLSADLPLDAGAMALAFIPSDAAMLAVQAGVVAAPRRPPELPWLERLSGPAWAVIPIASIVGVIFAIRYVSGTATGLTWLALIAVPLLAAAALGWAAAARAGGWPACSRRCSRWPGPSARRSWGEGAATLLSALSCVTLGVLLAAVTPPGWLKLGILAMAAADIWLVLSDLLQAPNARWSRPPRPRQRPAPAAERAVRLDLDWATATCSSPGCSGRCSPARAAGSGRSALLTLVLAGLFDLLFFVLTSCRRRFRWRWR